MRTTPRKGLQDIQTLTNRTSEARCPHKRFLRLAYLELKKACCQNEKRAATRRVDELNRQLAELDQERCCVLHEVQAASETKPHRLGTLPPADRPGPRTHRSFTLKY
ncbi:MAG: hypothetical protein ACYC35_23445 [Pirellulales bacterium]